MRYSSRTFAARQSDSNPAVRHVVCGKRLNRRLGRPALLNGGQHKTGPLVAKAGERTYFSNLPTPHQQRRQAPRQAAPTEMRSTW
jgi:hypothetical protein